MAVAVSQEMQIMRRRSGLARAVQDLQSPDLAKVKFDKPQARWLQSPDPLLKLSLTKGGSPVPRPLAKVKFYKPQVAAQTQVVAQS